MNKICLRCYEYFLKLSYKAENSEVLFKIVAKLWCLCGYKLLATAKHYSRHYLKHKNLVLQKDHHQPGLGARVWNKARDEPTPFGKRPLPNSRDIMGWYYYGYEKSAVVDTTYNLYITARFGNITKYCRILNHK